MREIERYNKGFIHSFFRTLVFFFGGKRASIMYLHICHLPFYILLKQLKDEIGYTSF